MSKTFEVKLNCPATEFVEKARRASAKNGVRFEGDEQTGQFAGLGVEGRYRIVDDALSLEIVKKPLVMPWSLIESKFRSFFA